MWLLAASALAGLDTSAQVGVGAKGGWYNCGDGWADAAPFLFGSVDVGSDESGVWGFVGLDSSPGLDYGVGCGADVFMTSAIMLTPGLWMGSAAFRVGGYGSIGWGGLAVGARLAALPVRAGAWRHGLELRAEVLLINDVTLFSVSYLLAVPDRSSGPRRSRPR